MIIDKAFEGHAENETKRLTYLHFVFPSLGLKRLFGLKYLLERAGYQTFLLWVSWSAHHCMSLT